MSIRKIDSELRPEDLNYILYARKSTEDDSKQVQSIDDQLTEMKKVASEKGLNIVEIIKESVSGGKYTREGFNRAMEMIEDGKANAFLCWKTDRLSRNHIDNGRIHQAMLEGKLKMIVTSDRVYTDDDDLLFDVEASMNAKYRKDLMKNVRRGMYSKASKGWFPSKPPIGYLNDRLKKIIIVDPENSEKVVKLFERYATGLYTIEQLTDYARDELNLKSNRAHTKGGQFFCAKGISKILSNCFYIGKFMYGGEEYNGNHPALISEKLFADVQERLGNNNHNTRPKGQTPIPFVCRGMLKCATCGYAILSERHYKHLKDGTTKEYIYCHCSGKCPEFKCPQARINIPEKEILSQIENELCKYTISEDFYRLAIEALQEEEDQRIAEQDSRIKAINRKISSVTNNLNNLRRMRYSGEITDQAWFLSESKTLEDEISSLEKSRNTVNRAARDWRAYADDVFMFARYAKEDFEKGTLEQKQYVIKALGIDLKLSGRTVEFTPNEFLVPIKKAVAKTAELNTLGRTDFYQGSVALKSSISELWCA